MAKSGMDLDDFSGAGATKQLHKTIKEFNESTSRQTTTLVRLTWAILILTGVMAIGLVVQIVIALS
jgi:hypothetical protein